MVADGERHRMISIERRSMTESDAFQVFQGQENSFRQLKEKNDIKHKKESKQNDQCMFCGKGEHK